MKRLLTYGEVLVRLTAAGNERISMANHYELYVGGAEVNTAAALAQWGFQTRVISAVPDNFMGQKVINTLKSIGINTESVKVAGDKMGLYFTEYGSGFKPAEVLYDRADSAFSNYSVDSDVVGSSLDDARIFHWTGITPAVSGQACDSLAALLERAEKRKLIISADLNYRSKLWKWGKSPVEVIPELVKRSNLLITTEESVKKMLGIALPDAPEEITPDYYNNLIKKLLDQYTQLEYVFVPVRRTISSKHNIITLFGQKRDGSIQQSRQFEITEMVDRIGAGDAMTAGILYGIANELGLNDTLNFAIAASALKHSILGDFIIASEDEVWQTATGSKAKINR